MPVIKVRPNSDEWLEERRRGIGASDAAAILGLDPWRSALDVWANKHALVPDEDATLPMRIGHLLEPIVAGLYTDATGVRLRRPAGMHQHAEHPMLRATIDRHIVGSNALVELKTAGHFAGREWGMEGTDEVPKRYIAQAMHQMSCTGADRVDLAVLIDNNSFRRHPILRDDKLIAGMEKQFVSWWERYIVQGEHPAASAQDEDLLRQLHPADDGRVIVATPEQAQRVGEYADALRRKRVATKDADAIRPEIIALIGDASALVLPDDERLTYKASKGRTPWKGVAETLARLLDGEGDLRNLVQNLTPETGARVLRTPRVWAEDPP